jgi:transcriptional regulator with XRE-family HTH domain
MTERMPFGRWLKQRRKMLDLTQEALAERVGCAVPTIRKFERGRCVPRATWRRC